MPLGLGVGVVVACWEGVAVGVKPVDTDCVGVNDPDVEPLRVPDGDCEGELPCEADSVGDGLLLTVLLELGVDGAVASCEGVAVGVKPVVTLCVGVNDPDWVPLRLTACEGDGEQPCEADGVQVGLPLIVPLELGVDVAEASCEGVRLGARLAVAV